MDNQLLQDIQTAILASRNTVELSQPIESLIQQFELPSPLPLNHLKNIAEIMRRRILLIRNLQDLSENADSHEQHPRVKVINWFGRLAHGLARYGAYPTAVNLLIELWNEFGKYQLALNETRGTPSHFYRAGISMYLGQIYLQYGKLGDAIWWLLHAHADDLLEGQTEGAAHDLLRLAFGVKDSVFDFMISRKNSNSIEIHTLFSEHLVMQLSLESEFAYLFSYPSSQSEFPIGYAYAQSMRARLDQKDSKGNLIGKPLKEFARYLVLLLTGWIPTNNVYHNRTNIDSDLVARYIREPEAISSSTSRAILIECKNIKDTLNVAETGYFLYRMHLTQVNVGILFVRNNLSGAGDDVAEHENARHLLDLAFQQSSAAVIVLDLNDLEQIVNGRKTVWTLIDSRIVERRFGTTKESEL